MTSRLHFALALALASFAGCTTQGVEPSPAALASSANGLAVVRVAREYAATAPERAPASVAVAAAFARYEGIGPDDVLELLGFAPRTGGLDGCSWGSTETVPALPADAVVDLLDVGALEVDLGHERLTLDGRLFPSVLGLVAGSLYTEERVFPPAPLVEEALGVELEPSEASPAELRLYAPGHADHGQLEAVLPAPAPLAGVVVDGLPLGAPLALDRDAHLGVQWEAGDPSDRVEIELRAGGRLLRCSTSDQGAFLVRVEALAAMPADPRAQLAVARVRREPIDVGGIDEAYAQLVARRSTPVELR